MGRLLTVPAEDHAPSSVLGGQNFLATVSVIGWKFRAAGENGHIIIGA